MIATRRLYLFLFLVAVLFALTFWFKGLAPAGFFLDTLLMILLGVDFFLTQSGRRLSAQRDVSDRLSIGRHNQAVVRVRNTGDASLECLLKDDYPQAIKAEPKLFQFQLGPSEEVTFQYSLFPDRRGRFRFGNIYLRYRSRLGLFWRQRVIKAETFVKVYSDLKALIELSIKLSSSSELGELHQRRRGQGTDFSSLKEYVIGDDSRSIDWKATARRNRPIVRTYEAEQEQKLLILLDAGRLMISQLGGLTRFDHALNAALSLALTGLTYNDQVGIGIFADKPLAYLPPRRGKGYLKKILEATASIEPTMVEPDYAAMLAHFATLSKSRSLFVVLTDLSDPSGSQALIAGLANLRKRHLTLCVTLKDKQIQRLCQPLDNPAAQKPERAKVFRRAIAIDLSQQRDLALGVLRQHGCLCIDEPPEDLSSQLVNSYLEIKRKALL
jgi:uncharacterized protein (DUF58 family)